MSDDPIISLVTPVYDTPETYLRAMVTSVLRQSWDAWELLLVDDCSPHAETRVLLNDVAALDPRIRVIERSTNGGISEASNDAIRAASGEFVGLLDHDDLLLPGALHRVATELSADREIDLVYTDEDKIDGLGRHSDAFAKPDWSPSRLRAQMYLGHFLVMRTELVRRVGSFRSEYDGSQDHDLALRVSEIARKIAHIPEVLYSWRVHSASTAGSSESKPYTWDAGIRAVSDHLERIGMDAEVVHGLHPNMMDLNRRVDPNRRVSVVIPTRGTAGDVEGVTRVFVVEAIRSVLLHTQHRLLEFVVVYDAVTPAGVLDELNRIVGDRLVLVEYSKPFNFSEKCNLGVVASSGDVIVLLNDDTEVLSSGIIEHLVGAVDEPGVGLVGVKLVYPDGSIQHAGHHYAENGFHHSFIREPGSWAGPFGLLHIDHDVSGVTGACVALTRDTYFAVGGLSEALPSNFNDVDLSYKVQSIGLRVLWIHRAELIHFESKTRESTVAEWEVAQLRSRWGFQFRDPFVLPEHPGLRASTPGYPSARAR